MENKNGEKKGPEEKKDRERSDFTKDLAKPEAGKEISGKDRNTGPVSPEEEKSPQPQTTQPVPPAPQQPAVASAPGGINYDKYDSQVKTLKNLGYTAQQITDNLLRLNPELHENKHVTSEVVGRYFPRPKSVLEEQKIFPVSGGMELTEETKAFIESVLRRQLDAFRNVLKEERERKALFGEALIGKWLEWGPAIISLVFFLSFAFLIYKGGPGAFKYIFYAPPGPAALSSYILYPLLVILVIIIGSVSLFSEGVSSRIISDSKALIYLLLLPIILLAPPIALERYNNESHWNNFLSIKDKEHFLTVWYDTDYKDRQIFLNRLERFIKLDTTDENDVTSVARILIYIDNDFANKDFKSLCQDLNKEMGLYRAVILYDESPKNRKKALKILTDIALTLKKNSEEMRSTLASLEDCFENMSEDVKYRGNFDRGIFKSSKFITRIMTTDNLLREKFIINLIEDTLKNDKDMEVKISTLSSLKELGKNSAYIEGLIENSQQNPEVLEELKKHL